MTDLIKQARELCEKATPGPWGRLYYETSGEQHFLVMEPKKKMIATVFNPNDGDFLFYGRTLVPALRDAAERKKGREYCGEHRESEGKP